CGSWVVGRGSWAVGRDIELPTYDPQPTTHNPRPTTYNLRASSNGPDQLIQQVNVPLLRGDQLVADQLFAGRVDVVGAFHVILQAVLFAFFQALQRRGVAEKIGRALGEFCPGAPGAGGIGRLASKLADSIAQRLRRPRV